VTEIDAFHTRASVVVVSALVVVVSVLVVVVLLLYVLVLVLLLVRLLLLLLEGGRVGSERAAQAKGAFVRSSNGRLCPLKQ